MAEDHLLRPILVGLKSSCATHETAYQITAANGGKPPRLSSIDRQKI